MKKPGNIQETDNLRQKAEARLKGQVSLRGSPLSQFEALKLIHELEVHQVELEMQNQELTLARARAEAATQKAKILYDSAPSGYFTLARDGTMIELNPAGASLFMKERLELINKRFGVFLPNESRPVFNNFLETVFNSSIQQRCEILLFSDGHASTYVYLTGIASGGHEYCRLTAVDITARKVAEEKLSESEQHYRLLFNSIDEGFCIIEMIFDENEKPVDINLLDVNPAFQKQTGLTYTKGKNMRHLIPGIEEYWFEIYGKVALAGEPVRFTNHAESVQRWYDVYAFRFGLPSGRQVGILFNDITLRKCSEEEIKRSKEQLTQLFKHLNEVKEEERTSIAREIHDDLGQSLAGLKLELIGMKEDMMNHAATKFKVDNAISLVGATIKKVQKLSAQLRPQMLDELGLASAIEWQVNESKKRTGVKSTLDLEEIEDIPDFIAISMFRIFQASLTNIMLHSKARSIKVKLSKKDEMLQLSVKDDGIGISKKQLESKSAYGIMGMRERANQINGIFEIHTKLNEGTEITVIVPLR